MSPHLNVDSTITPRGRNDSKRCHGSLLRYRCLLLGGGEPGGPPVRGGRLEAECVNYWGGNSRHPSMKSFGIFSVMGSCRRFGLGGCGMITLDFWRGRFLKCCTQDFENSWAGVWGNSKGPANPPYRRRVGTFLQDSWRHSTN